MTQAADDLALANGFLSSWIRLLNARTTDDPGLLPFVDALKLAQTENRPGPSAGVMPARPELAIFEDFDQVLNRIEIPGIDAGLVQNIARQLNWYELYSGENTDAVLSSGMAAAHIVGPKGLMHSDSVVAGMFMLAPDLYYPKHDHVAEELYQVVSGSVAIAHGVSDLPKDYSKGGICRQPSNILHDLQVGSGTALVLYAWVGDLDCPVWMWRREGDTWWRDLWERNGPDGFRIIQTQRVN